MIRMVLERVALFAIPFILFAAYVMANQRVAQRPRPDTPWVWLSIAGLVLVILSFVVVGLTEGETTKGVYVPPQEVNGKIVPGHVDQGRTP
jgi:drug/metabolite transporter (DMT)-like permease